MARHNSFWKNFFRATRATYRAQHGARTYRAWTSGSPKRVVNLYGRRMFYKAAARIANRLFHN
jgi:hypothetical protein